MKKYSFKNDYSELGHEQVLSNLLKMSSEQLDGYGLDSVSAQAKVLITKHFALDKKVDIHFLSGGTQTNLVLIASALKDYEAVISADSGHINTHEAGAIEHNGNKICSVQNKDGKLTSQDIINVCEYHTDEHMVKPKLIFISQSTEKGTTYTLQELKTIYETCKKLNLYLYIDGARIGTSFNDNFKPTDVAKVCDCFYIGGTKNGSPLGEALCIINEQLKTDFRYYLKQHGALLAKGGLIGSCFKTLFESNLFFDLANHANKMAQKIVKALAQKGYQMSSNSPTNQIFPILPNKKIVELEKCFDFYVWEKVDTNNSVIRLVCSWATNENEVDKLIQML